MADKIGYNRKLCIAKAPTIYPACRTIVPQLQAADRKVQGALAAARSFIKTNPTLTPVSLIADVEQALATFQSLEAKYGVK